MHIENEFTSSHSWTEENFLGSAHFFFLAQDYNRLMEKARRPSFLSREAQHIITSDRLLLDLLITKAGYRSADLDQVAAHSGDTFSHHFYGYSPVIIKVQAMLIDTVHSFGKAEMMELYRWVFRASQVARSRIVPVLSFVGALSQGAMLDLDITESADLQDALQVQFSWLVFSLRYQNTQNSGAKQVTVNFAGNHDAWSNHMDKAKAAPAGTDRDIALNLYNDPTAV